MTFPIIEKLGGKERVHQAILEGGYSKFTLDALYRWGRRGKIPGWAIIALDEIAKKQRVKTSMDDYKPTNNERS